MGILLESLLEAGNCISDSEWDCAPLLRNNMQFQISPNLQFLTEQHVPDITIRAFVLVHYMGFTQCSENEW